MRNRIPNVSLIALMITAAAATTGAADTRWSRLVPEGTGFSVEVPGDRDPSDISGQYSYSSGLWFYCVKLLPTDPGTRALLERGDKKALKTRLESSRDLLVATVKATSDRSSFGEIDGYPSLRFSLAIDELAGSNLMVLTSEQTYMVMTIGPKGSPDDNANRFLQSFRLIGNATAAIPGPERTVREFVQAVAMHDTQTFGRMTRPDPRASRFINAQPLTADERAEAARKLETLQVRQHDDVLLRGRSVDADVQGDYPVGSVAHYVASSNGGPTLVTLVREADGWKVDLRWWLAMLDMADAPAPGAGSPDHAARRLMLALIGLNREEATRFAVPGADVKLLFAAAPSVREPSGVLEAAAMEMPLVEVGAGEFYRLPSGRVVEGSAAADRKILVGQFGPVKIPFVLRRVGGAWRVEAEPYFVLINQ